MLRDLRNNLSKKHLILGAILLLLLVGALVIKHLMDNFAFRPHGTLYITSVPEEVSVEFMGHSRHINTSHTRSIPVPVGEYDITFRAKGFAAYTEKISIKQSKEESLAFMLFPETDEARREIAKPKYEEPKGAVEGHLMQRGLKDIEKRYPLLEKLPINSKWYSITQCASGEDNKPQILQVCIRASEAFKKEAYDALASLGYDLDKYDIFVNEEPLPKKKEVNEGIAEPCSESVNGYCYIYRE